MRQLLWTVGLIFGLTTLMSAGCGTATPISCDPASEVCAGQSGDDPGSVGDPGPGGDHGSMCGAETWNNFASGFFSSNCASCHGWATSQSGVKSRSSAIISRVSGGSMPPRGGLSASDEQRALDWLHCGAP
jgi:hypothetical protein